jgi:hypothetical protein
MMGPYQIRRIEWQGIEIEVRWNPVHYRDDEVTIAHLELQTDNRQRLPMTETGYRSHFVQRANVDAYGGPVEYVNAWLEEAAMSADWKRYVQESKQLTLF